MKKIRHFLSVGDLSSSELNKILKRSQFYKKKRINSLNPLRHQTIGLLFQKASTRTRVSFEVGIQELGGRSLFLDQHNSQMGRGETLFDTFKVLERYLNGLIVRNHDHRGLVETTPFINMPIINGLSEAHHPAQGVADALTIMENMRVWNKKTPTIAYLGEGNNVTISLIEICSYLHWHLKIASPKNYACSFTLLKNVMVNNRYITLTEDPYKAVKDADVIYTDTWFSMAKDKKEEKKNKTKEKALRPYQVNGKLLRYASPRYIFLHCLPAYRGLEVTGNIIDGIHSKVWQQAENRLHAQKALMEFFFTRQFT